MRDLAKRLNAMEALWQRPAAGAGRIYDLGGLPAMSSAEKARLDELLERAELGGTAVLTGDEVAEGAALLRRAGGVPDWWPRW